MFNEDMLSAADESEFDFSDGSTVEKVEGIWTIVDAGENDTDTVKGTGHRYEVTFTGPTPFPITVRLFTSYKSKTGKDISRWLNQQRGALKELGLAALQRKGYRPQELIGRQVRARTKDDGQGYATLTRFKPVLNEAIAE